MNIFDEISKYQGDNCTLVEYELFYDNIFKGCCRFAIDEQEDLKKLNNSILKLKEIDKNAKIYVYTYGIDLIKDWKCIYGDILLIDTIMDIGELHDIFQDAKEVEPSDIVLLSEDETINQEEIAVVFLSEGTVEDYRSFIKKKQINDMKRLFWD